jgi:pyridoxal phosphate enzyme (YggS family)
MNSPGKLNRDSLNLVKDRIHIACKNSGRLVEEIQIVAVTKTFGIEAIESAISAGIKCIGENKAQEVEAKIPLIQDRKNSEIHFIGHLQSNKVRKVLNFIDVIETVDSLKLANRINLISKEMNKTTSVFLQIKTVEDPAKFGFIPNEIFNSAEEISNMENLILSGVMAIPPFVNDQNVLAPIFDTTRKIREKIRKEINSNCNDLSMGMSRDFELAIKYGATHIRLGTILYGDRN